MRPWATSMHALFLPALGTIWMSKTHQADAFDTAEQRLTSLENHNGGNNSDYTYCKFIAAVRYFCLPWLAPIVLSCLAS
ncbi:hypothetical protein O9929_16780 [Vibrio lentus]|nr:hypothetical protein [Vibrio lentus]